MSKKHILITGTGSVGMRHARNLTSLGATVSGMDPRGDRRAAFVDEFGTAAHQSLDDALAAGELVALLPGYRVNPGAMDIELLAIYQPSRRGSAKVHAFIDLLEDALGEAAP